MQQLLSDYMCLILLFIRSLFNILPVYIYKDLFLYIVRDKFLILKNARVLRFNMIKKLEKNFTRST